MVRLTADLLLAAPVRFNPADDRELVLRGLKAPAIENLGVLRDQFDCLDLSDNELPKLENFPLMKRLRSLLLPNNRVSRIADGLGASLPALAHLVLTNNRIAALGEVEALGSLGGSLTSLSLLGNPVTRKQHYRLFTIWSLPRLAVLDFQRVRRKERVAAAKLFASKAGRAFAEEVTRTRYAAAAAAPAADGSGGSSASSSAAAAPAPAFTPEELEAIQAAIAAADTGGEIEEIEACLRKGVLPPSVAAALGRSGSGGSSGSSPAAAAEGSSAAAAAAPAAAQPADAGSASASAAAGNADAPMDTS